MAPAESSQLAEAQPGEPGGQDHRPKRDGDGVGDGEDLLNGGDPPLIGSFDSCALDDARVLNDDAVLDGRAEDGAQESIAFGDGAGADASVYELGMPSPDSCRRQAVQLDRAERWHDVQPEFVLVQLSRAGSEVGPFLQPLRRVHGEREVSGIRIDPRSPFDLCPERSEVGVCFALGTEGVGSQELDPSNR